MTDITTAIDLAMDRNAEALTQQIGPVKQVMDSEGLMHLRHFAGWCRQRGVKFCPAKPATIAMFIRTESANHVSAEKILAALRAIEQMHDDQMEANPVACAAPRAELERVTKIEAPRTWPKADRPLFQSLPPDVRAVINRNADFTTLALRRLQNKVAAISKKAGITNDDTDTKKDD